MKKLVLSLLTLFAIGFWSTLAEWCFHDAINVVNKAWYITQWARIRNLACMDGSAVMTTLKAGTKVRIIWQTAWTKIVLPDGQIWRVWNSFVKEDSSWSWVPELNSNHVIDSYCDTTNLSRCPYPSAPGVIPDFYYTDTTTNTNNNTNTTTTTTTTVPLNTAILDEIVNQFLEKLNERYWDDEELKTTKINNTIIALNSLKYQYSKLAASVDYIVQKLKSL